MTMDVLTRIRQLKGIRVGFIIDWLIYWLTEIKSSDNLDLQLDLDMYEAGARERIWGVLHNYLL